MVKLVYVLRRKEGMSREEFQRYWREVHAPLVSKHADALGIRRYIQVHTGYDQATTGIVEDPRGLGDPYDGVAEL